MNKAKKATHWKPIDMSGSVYPNGEPFPEAETMETRKVKEWTGARKFWMVMFTIAVLMTAGNWIIGLLMN
ncbi:MAG: hypothetical protein IPP74_14730 [Alphaproteobacteria bacterium]|nr:hypothetical protein [Alphaproteobacteria bacterium]